MEKYTRISAMDYAIANATEDTPIEVIEKWKAIKASFEKKANAERKPSKEKIANDELRATILDAMEVDKRYTLAEIATLVGLEGATPQRMSGLIRDLVISEKNPNGSIQRVEEKRKTYFVRVA